MNEIFRPLRKFVLLFFDDIIVYSGSKEHETHLAMVLQTLEDH